MADTDFPDALGECVEKFWADNTELRNRVLRDWYAGGRVTTDTNMAGLRAVDKWLAGAALSNGER